MLIKSYSGIHAVKVLLLENKHRAWLFSPQPSVADSQSSRCSHRHALLPKIDITIHACTLYQNVTVKVGTGYTVNSHYASDAYFYHRYITKRCKQDCSIINVYTPYADENINNDE